MLVADLLSHVKDDVLRDFETPTLFSSDSLLAYLNAGLATMARKTHIFLDDVSIQTEAFEPAYELPANTLFVRSVINERGIHLHHLNRKVKVWRIYGVPTAYFTDTPYRHLTLSPTPQDVYDFTVVRVYKPASLIEMDELPIEDDYAHLLGDYITFRALMTNAPDESNMIGAKVFEQSWNEGLRNIAREQIRYSAGDVPTAQPRLWT